MHIYILYIYIHISGNAYMLYICYFLALSFPLPFRFSKSSMRTRNETGVNLISLSGLW